MVEAAHNEIVLPTVRQLAAEGTPYRGVLYAGLMVTDEGPKLVEHNARFGDPECQVLMMRLASDIVPYLMAAATGGLSKMREPSWRAESAICVVLAARGYPDSPLPGSIIRGAEQDFGPNVKIFHAGTDRRGDGALRAAGGRVLNVCALGSDLRQARDRAYEAISHIDWPGGFHRTDIGWRALGRV
jgi:phosphoribosylamine--glycine ligase